MTQKPLLVHGSCVQLPSGHGLLVLGESGSGKTSLAAELIHRGARLVADDQVLISRKEGADGEKDALVASAPLPLMGVIELRGLGVVRLSEVCAASNLAFAVSLLPHPSARLPDAGSELCLLGLAIPHYELRQYDAASAARILLFSACYGAGAVVERLAVASESV